MRYVKTFENFSYNSINEEEGFFGDTWQKIKDLFSMIKDDYARSVVDKIQNQLKLSADQPEMQKFYKELQEKINALPAEDKAKLEEMKNNPSEVIEKVKEIESEVTESLRLNEEVDWQKLTGKVLKFLGVSSALGGVITWAVACLQGYGMLGAIGGLMLYSIAWVPIVSVLCAVILGPVLMVSGDSLQGKFD